MFQPLTNLLSYIVLQQVQPLVCALYIVPLFTFYHLEMQQSTKSLVSQHWTRFSFEFEMEEEIREFIE